MNTPRIICVGGLWSAGKSTAIARVWETAQDRVTRLDVKQLTVKSAEVTHAATLRIRDLRVSDLRAYYAELALHWRRVLMPRVQKDSRHVIIETSPLVLTWLRRSCTHSILLDTPPAVCSARLAVRNGVTQDEAAHLIAIQRRACRLGRVRQSMRVRVVATDAQLRDYLSELVR